MTKPRKALDQLFWEHFTGQLQDAKEAAAEKERAIPPAQPALVCRGVDLDEARKIWSGK